MPVLSNFRRFASVSMRGAVLIDSRLKPAVSVFIRGWTLRLPGLCMFEDPRNPHGGAMIIEK